MVCQQQGRGIIPEVYRIWVDLMGRQTLVPTHKYNSGLYISKILNKFIMCASTIDIHLMYS